MKENVTIKENRSGIRILAASIGVIAFVVIAWAVIAGKTMAFDDVVRYAFYDVRSDGLTVIAKAVTFLGNWQSIVILCLILLIAKPTRVKYGIPVSAGALFVTVLNRLIKIAVERPRPDQLHHLIEESGFSFASGHAISSMFVFGMLIYLVRKNFRNRAAANVLTVILLIPAFGIGLSRVYLGVHYPTDVLAGWCLGFAVIAVTAEVTERIGNKRP